MMKKQAVRYLQSETEDPAVLKLIKSHEMIRDKLSDLLSNCEELRNELLVSRKPTTAVDTMMAEIRKAIDE